MIESTARLVERYFNLRYERTVILLRRAVVTLAGLLFILTATVIVAADSIFVDQNGIASLQVGSLAPRDIFAPVEAEYVSDVLTEQARQSAGDSVTPVFNLPEISIARQRTTIATQILDYVENVRRDTFADETDQARDIRAIRELQLDDAIIQRIIVVDDETWDDIAEQIITVLERVMLREEIRESNIATVIQGLPNQVNLRFAQEDVNVVVAIVEDLIRPNTSLDVEATEAARQIARDAAPDVRRNFEVGQLVINEGTQIEAEDFEALQELGLLQLTTNRFDEIVQAFLTSVIVMVIAGLYILRFEPDLIYSSPRFLTLICTIFLIVLFGARLGLNGQFYIYPTAALALLYVSITSTHVAIIGVLGLSILVGVMANNSLEIATLIACGGIIGALNLKRTERLNTYFLSGLVVAVTNMSIAAIFNLGATVVGDSSEQLVLLMVYSLLNGILTAAAAIAGLYIVTLIFNLPTALKLSELSQPNQPLLQRLLREAPGTYQHSLQVANLSEQAANAIGANAELVHVAALYHDIGKMLNPAFFTENQRDIGNPHDTLNDPYRSADIIISHITEGDEMARQYRLPMRLRDFIREHHGTSQVYVFYRQAVILAGDDESAVDSSDFTYPGPKPRSRETAILMLADSCEAAVRSKQPKSKAEIEETVRMVIDGKRRSGQLDNSRLTLNDLKTIESIFIDMMQAIFHPRINYEDAISRVRGNAAAVVPTAPKVTKPRREREIITTGEQKTVAPMPPSADKVTSATNRTVDLKDVLSEDDDDSPLPEVPRLRRKATEEAPMVNTNGVTEATESAESGDDSETSSEATEQDER